MEQFRKTPELQIVPETIKGNLSMTFDQVPFSVAMTEISNKTGVAIVWGQEADKSYISGTYDGVDVYALLLAIAKRYRLSVTNYEGVIFLGSDQSADAVSLVVRSPFVSEQMGESLKQCLSTSGRIVEVGSCFVVTDTGYNVKKFVEVMSTLRERLGRSYIAELFFIRMKSSALLDLQARLQAESVDLFSCSWNLDRLFSMALSVDGKRQFQTISNSPRMYLSEGRSATLSVGSELIRSKNSISTEGYSTVSGYERFSDGIEVTLRPARVDSHLISLDVNLSVSKFDDGSITEIPANEKSSIVSPGVLVTDGDIYFLGSLQMSEKSKGSGLVGVNFKDSDEIITVWVRIREVFLEKNKLYLTFSPR